MRTIKQPDIDICRECGEHAEFGDDGLSNCCGARPYDADPYLDMDRRGRSYLRAAVMIFTAVSVIGCASAPVAETPKVAEQPSSSSSYSLRAETYFEEDRELYCDLLVRTEYKSKEFKDYSDTIFLFIGRTFRPGDCPITNGIDADADESSIIMTKEGV